MNAAVTGGTGFVGQVLVRLLAARGGAVRVLVRQPKDDPTIRSLGGEPVRGDLTVPGGCEGLVCPGDVVFHSAARVDLAGRWADFRETNIEGTRRLVEHALTHRPKRFVHVSSAGVYSPLHLRGSISAERTLARPSRYNLYARAKLAAETIVRTECERAGCPWTILRLGFVYGPGNRPLLTQVARLRRRGGLSLIGRGDNRIATLHVDDAARAVLLAGTHPAAVGKIYDVASDEVVTQRQFVNATADTLHLSRACRCLHPRVAYVAAWLAELVAQVTGGEPPFNRALVVIMGVDQALDASRIRNELGWRPQVNFAEGIRGMQESCCRSQADGWRGIDHDQPLAAGQGLA